MTQDEKEFRQGWQRLKDTFIGIILALVIALFIHKCSGDFKPVTVSVKVPEAKGGFKSVKPYNDTIYRTDTIYLKGKSVKVKDLHEIKRIKELESENRNLLQAYSSKNDSVKKGLFRKSIQLNAFNKKFEDSLVEIDVTGVSRGTVESLGLDYKLKERKIQVPEKEIRFRLLGGIAVSNDLLLQKPLFSANLGIQNKRGNVLRFGYDSEKRISVGYDISISKIEK